jgi:flagellar basal body-associated protein FliL
VAEQTAVAELSEDKVVLDKADLPIPQAEEEAEEIIEETPSEDEADRVVAPEPPLKPKGKIAIAGAALALLLLGGAWFLFSGGGEEEAPLPSETLPAASATGLARATLEPFIVPIPVSSKGRLLRASVMLEFANRDEMQELMSNRLLLMRDIIYRSLHNRSAEDLNRARMNEALSSQIKLQINNALGREAIKQVYLPDFLFVG